MTNISKQLLPKKVKIALFNQFIKQISKKQPALMFLEILSETEQIMVVKRFAVVAMLGQGESTYAIAKALRVSDKTVRDINKARSIGTYKNIETLFSSQSFNRTEFWDTLDKLLRLGMPRYGQVRLRK